MRKAVVGLLVAVTALGVVASGHVDAQRRRRPPPAAPAISEPPVSAQIVTEMGGMEWGWNKDRVVEYFRQQITARYQPLLRNKGMVEQDRLLRQRDEEVAALRSSLVNFDGRQDHRRWDTSFLAEEYTHNNGESMMMREDPTNGNREFFFFFNDRLWKRFQARPVPRGMDFPGYLAVVEAVFGPGLRLPREPEPPTTELWQDDTTRVRVVNNSTFFGAFCLVFEERATLGRLAQLRRNVAERASTSNSTRGDGGVQIESHAGAVEGSDANEDIVDRLTGRIRRTQTAPDGGAGVSSGTTPRAADAGAPASPDRQRQQDEQTFRGL